MQTVFKEKKLNLALKNNLYVLGERLEPLDCVSVARGA